jgi:hypothetical protein
MNLSDAIPDHATMCYEVTEYAKRPNGSLKPADLAREDACTLGQWLTKDGATHEALPAYASLNAAHAKFHRASADTVQQADDKALPEGWQDEKAKLKASLGDLCGAIMKMDFTIG